MLFGSYLINALKIKPRDQSRMGRGRLLGHSRAFIYGTEQEENVYLGIRRSSLCGTSYKNYDSHTRDISITISEQVSKPQGRREKIPPRCFTRSRSRASNCFDDLATQALHPSRSTRVSIVYVATTPQSTTA